MARWPQRALPLLALGIVASLVAGVGRAGGGDGGLDWRRLGPDRGLLGALVPARAVAVGPGPGGARDVFLAWVRETPSGSTLAVYELTNLTRSPDADEALVALGPGAVAYAVPDGEGASASVEVLVLGRGERRGDLTAGERAADVLTSLDLWGQPTTPRRLRLGLRVPARRLELDWRGPRLIVGAEAGTLELDPGSGRLTRGDALGTVSEHGSGQPDLFRWAVDRLRYSRLVGPVRLQRLEQLYLDLDDAWAGLVEARGASASPPPAAHRLGRAAAPRPGTTWPPPPIAPLLAPALEAEGEWSARDERFVTTPAGAPPLLVTTVLRTDAQRPGSSRVVLTAWDPQWLDLDWVAGTVEPRSTAGLAGAGQVPAPAVERLVAGFNGGFQAVDGAFGLRTLAGPFLPPVAYGATVARLRDGRLGLGTWPAAPVRESSLPAFRQNLTALVENGEINPHGRRFWGGVPAELADTARTDRTGLCLTIDGLMLYLWGQRVTVDGLARAMLAARCDFGMLLDINFSNTVFETYRVGRRGTLPRLDRPLDASWEAEGPVPGRVDLDYRVQAMAPGMTRVGFPRFIRTELRDFFYLALRPEALAPPRPGVCALAPVDDGLATPPRAWRCELAVPGGGSTTLHELEPRRLVFSLAPPGGPAAGGLLTWAVAASTVDRAGPALVVEAGPIGGSQAAILDRVDEADRERAGLVLVGLAPGRVAPGADDPSAGLVAAVGPGGELALARARWADARALAAALAAAGFERSIFLPEGPDRLVAAPDPTPMALRIFGDTRPVPPRVWAPLHARAQERIVALGLTRQYVQIRDYLEREPLERR